MDYKLLLAMAEVAGDTLLHNAAVPYRVAETVYRILQ